jgi:hypothetical protein
LANVEEEVPNGLEMFHVTLPVGALVGTVRVAEPCVEPVTVIPPAVTVELVIVMASPL